MGNRNRAVNNLGSGWIKNTPKYCFPCYFSLTNSMRKENFMDAIIILVPLYLSKKYEKKTFYCIKIKLMLFLILLTSILRRFVKEPKKKIFLWKSYDNIIKLWIE